jgi:type II secretion system protein J
MTRRAGFTLIETLVAMVVLVIIIGSIYGTFRAANMTVTGTEERADVYQTARVLLAQMNAELCSAYQPARQEGSSMQGENTEGNEYAAQKDKISFLTTARKSMSSVDGGGDLCRVTYSVETDPNEKPLGLFVSEDFRPGLAVSDEKKQPVRLSPMVVGLNCRYLDGRTGEWLDDWVEEPAMPKAVRVELVLKPERDSAKVVTVASTANLAISSGPGEEQVYEEDENAAE